MNKIKVYDPSVLWACKEYLKNVSAYLTGQTYDELFMHPIENYINQDCFSNPINDKKRGTIRKSFDETYEDDCFPARLVRAIVNYQRNLNRKD